MKSIRLTIALKDSIVRAALDFRFAEEEEQLLRDRKEFGDRCYLHVYDEKAREIMGMAQHYFYGRAFDMDASIRMYFGGRNVSLPMSKERPFFSVDPEEANKVLNDHPLAIEFDRLQGRKENLREEKKEIRAYIRQVVNSVSTTKKLLEVWPDCEPFIEQAVPAVAPMHLPAIKIKDLNRKLFGEKDHAENTSR